MNEQRRRTLAEKCGERTECANVAPCGNSGSENIAAHFPRAIFHQKIKTHAIVLAKKRKRKWDLNENERTRRRENKEMDGIREMREGERTQSKENDSSTLWWEHENKHSNNAQMAVLCAVVNLRKVIYRSMENVRYFIDKKEWSRDVCGSFLS